MSRPFKRGYSTSRSMLPNRCTTLPMANELFAYIARALGEETATPTPR
jgi:hypothetical protein